MQRLGKSALLFIAIGIAIYALVYYAAEQLMYRTGRSNPFFKIATVERPTFDWIILGASHAMPFDFDDFNAFMERETGMRILNLASPGTGPLYNRFVLEHFLTRRRANSLLYVVDSFAFYSPTWNEERFSDAKLLRRTPFEPAIARRLVEYSRSKNVDPRAVADYVTGFSKINNRERFEPDIWEGEKQFDRIFRPSTVATRKRIEYLYPGRASETRFARYLAEFDSLIALARQENMRVAIIKMPLLAQFRAQLPNESAFDDALAKLSARDGVTLHDFSPAMNEPRHYFDTDHLNRAGLTEFFSVHLKALLVSQNEPRQSSGIANPASDGPSIQRRP